MRSLAILLIISLLFAVPAQLFPFSAAINKSKPATDFEQLILLHSTHHALPASDNTHQNLPRLLVVWLKLSLALNNIDADLFTQKGQEFAIRKTILEKNQPIKNNQLNFIYPFKDYWPYIKTI
jgi:hypothetical protein